jgi:hypothetical protein
MFPGGGLPSRFVFCSGQLCMFYFFLYLPLPIFFPKDAALVRNEDVFTAALTTACHRVAYVRKKVFGSSSLKENLYLSPCFLESRLCFVVVVLLFPCAQCPTPLTSPVLSTAVKTDAEEESARGRPMMSGKADCDGRRGVIPTKFPIRPLDGRMQERRCRSCVPKMQGLGGEMARSTELGELGPQYCC